MRRLAPKRATRKRLVIIVVIFAGLLVGGYWMTHSNSGEPQSINSPETPVERNEIRKFALQSIADGLNTYVAQKGRLPLSVASVETGICSGSGLVCRKSKLADLSYLPLGGFMTTLPSDPVGGTGQYTTGYTILQNHEGKIHLSAPRAEAGARISLTLK